jgi:hypothetical protein
MKIYFQTPHMCLPLSSPLSMLLTAAAAFFLEGKKRMERRKRKGAAFAAFGNCWLGGVV